MITCANHPGREAASHCRMCEKWFCSDCYKIKTYKDSHFTVCALCDNPITDITHYLPAPPFWKGLPYILRFPFDGQGLFFMIIFPILSVAFFSFPRIIVSLDPGGFTYLDRYNPIAFSVYFIFMFPLFYHIINAASDGDLEFPEVKLRGNVFDALGDMMPAILGPFIGLFWPAVLIFMIYWSFYNGSPSAAQKFFTYTSLYIFFFYIFFALFLLPMTILIMSVFRNLWTAFNLINIYRQIKLIWHEYLILVSIIFIMLSGYTGIRYVLRELLLTKPILPIIAYYFIEGGLHIYLVMVIGQMLGYTAFQCRFRLKWWSQYETEPVFMIDGKPVVLSEAAADMKRRPPKKEKAKQQAADGGVSSSKEGGVAVAAGVVAEAAIAEADTGYDEELSEKITHAMYLNDHGSYDQAADIFEKILKDHPNNFSALQGRLMTAFKLQDHAAINKYGKIVATDLARQYAFEALWDMYKEYKDAVPEFSFESAELKKLCEWLCKEQMHLEAARAFRELAVVYPDDSFAPEALYQCGELLLNECDKPDNAKNVFKGIIERYSDTTFAEQAKKALEGMDSKEI